MRRALRFSVVILLAGAGAWGASQLPRALARIEAFDVRDFALEGARFLSTEEAVRWAEVPSGASVWDEPDPWERRLAAHPLVEEASVERKLPATLVFRVRERVPVALVPGPTLEPVDGSGEALPLDPASHRLDLPVIRPRTAGTGRGLTPEELHGVAGEVGRLRELDPAFLATVSEVVMGDRGALAVRLVEPAVDVWFRPPLTALRLQEGLEALEDARGKLGADGVRSVDLRFEDQVVIRSTGSSTRQTD